jgi:hypothetical protein
VRSPGMTGGKGGALHKIRAREGGEVMGESRTRRGTTPAILERSVRGQARRVRGSMSDGMAKPGGRSEPRVWRWEPVSTGVGGEDKSEDGSGRGLALATVMLCP